MEKIIENAVEPKDFLGRPLYLEDIVVFSTSLGPLKIGKIVDFFQPFAEGFVEIKVMTKEKTEHTIWKEDLIYKV